MRPMTLLSTLVVSLALAGTVAAATGPSVSTSAASSVSPNAATLNGSVNPNGVATTWYFDYGTTARYGSKTAAQNAGAGTSNIAVSANVAALKANEGYHFRLVATSAGGTSVGADVSFSTGKEPTNATPAFALIMARMIRSFHEMTGIRIGFKPAGGIGTAKDAIAYLTVMKEELGNRWLEPDLFRLGASSLLTDIERQLDHFVTGHYSAAHRHPMG